MNNTQLAKITEVIEKKDLAIDKLINDSMNFFEKGYFSDKSNFQIEKISGELKNLNFSNTVRMLHLTKFTYEEKENVLDKLSNIFSALYSNQTSLFLILDSNGETCDFYLGVKDEQSIAHSFATLKASLNGNFQGIDYDTNLETEDIEDIMDNILSENVKEISTLIGIPTLKAEKRENFFQGIEKVIFGMEGKKFSALFIATPIDDTAIKDIKKGYENLYSQIYPFTNINLSLNKNEALSYSATVGESFTKSYSQNFSRTDSTNKSYTTSKSKTTGTSYSNDFSLIGNLAGAAIPMIASSLPFGNIAVSAAGLLGGEMFQGLGSFSKSNSETVSHSETTGSSKSNTSGYSFTESKGIQNSTTQGQTDSLGKTIQINQKNRALENILNKLEKHIERLEAAEGSGLWNVGTYFLSDDPQDSLVAANIYNGIIRGEQSGIEKNTICTFRENKFFGENDELEKLKDYLYNFSNPILKVKDMYTTLGSIVTNDELAIKLNLPEKSVAGLDVIKMAAFGRNQQGNIKNGIEIGKLYHLGKTYKSPIKLDLESLTSHTFITGSTGSGKSNAVYTILEELYKKDIKFLVVEPAKGEYKNVFGGRHNVNVYGTNINYSPLLKINPFSFPKNIHVLEHIDRLIEIFNACWPLYAAMPAILKDAIERAYKMVGWDLQNSINLFGENRYPTLKELKIALTTVINSSSYSQESKGNYIGALLTRVNSLSNGIVGNIFVENELTNTQLFDSNVIVDISRVASSETKALIMGILFIKLQEHRISSQEDENSKLKHITVLEEAHHLLKHTLSVSGGEGGNLQGKSVEMLTNAIAEMRTYGEGFLIVDQAPELLDRAVIRNTNTKICLRLPNLTDREIVGKSMNLSYEQIEELAKLDTGVAAVTQNAWKDTCLVKFNHMENIQKYEHKNNSKVLKVEKSYLKYLYDRVLPPNEKLTESEKEKIKKSLDDIKNLEVIKDKWIYDTINGKTVIEVLEPFENNIQEWNRRANLILNNILDLGNSDKYLRMEIIKSLIKKDGIEKQDSSFYEKWISNISEGL